MMRPETLQVFCGKDGHLMEPSVEDLVEGHEVQEQKCRGCGNSIVLRQKVSENKGRAVASPTQGSQSGSARNGNDFAIHSRSTGVRSSLQEASQ